MKLAIVFGGSNLTQSMYAHQRKRAVDLCVCVLSNIKIIYLLYCSSVLRNDSEREKESERMKLMIVHSPHFEQCMVALTDLILNVYRRKTQSGKMEDGMRERKC